MFSRIRRHLNATTVVALVALVFAMTGGAFAVGGKGVAPAKLSAGQGASARIDRTAGAGGALAVAAKGKGKNGVRGPAGPAGKQGPVGKEGPAGKEGKAGPAGKEGREGPVGKEGPAGKEGKQGEPGKQGYPGQSGFTETLPPTKTETGTWSFAAPAGALISVPLSFPISLAEALQGSGCSEGKSPCQVHWITSGKTTTECPGSAEKPEAAVGNLCVYLAEIKGKTALVAPAIFAPNSFLGEGTGTAGAVLFFSEAEGEEASGTGDWAVTAPEEEA